MAYPQNVDWQTVRTVTRAALTGTFQNLGTGLTGRAKGIKIVNDTNAFLEISIDGTNVQDVYPANSGTIWDITANKVRDDGSFLRQGTQFEVRHDGTAPTLGSGVYLVVLEEAS